MGICLAAYPFLIYTWEVVKLKGIIMKKYIACFLLLTGILCMLSGYESHAEGKSFLFEDGDVVGFIGDSITHVEYTGISYEEFICNYYMTRYPNWNLEFRNLGTASYTAADAVSLYGEKKGIRDAAIDGITKAVVMFGMNEALAETPVSTYIRNIRRLVELLEEKGLDSQDIILVAPTPYDQTRSSNYTEDGEKLENTDDFLTAYVPELEALAEELGTHYVDLHTPLLQVTELVQGKIADDTLTVRDNVHPNAMGNSLAGYYFLIQQGADSQVASLTLNAEGETVTENAEAQLLRKKNDRYIRLSYQADSLPMAVTYEFNEATQYFEVVDAISWENLQVEGLGDDTAYTVYMDYRAVGTYTGAQLAAGINLSNCDLNPGQLAAKEMEVLNQQWQTVSSDYRSVIRQATKGNSNLTQEDVDAAYEAWQTETEGLRTRMYEIVRKSAASSRTVELVSEGYHVWKGQEVWMWIVELIFAVCVAAAAVAGYVIYRKKHKH